MRLPRTCLHQILEISQEFWKSTCLGTFPVLIYPHYENIFLYVQPTFWEPKTAPDAASEVLIRGE